MKSATNNLTTWIFKQPLIFAIAFFFIGFAVIFGYSIITSLLNIESVEPLLFVLVIAFIISAYFLIIKKLPHDDMAHSDFVAITNAGTFIAILIPVITLLIIGNNQDILKNNIMRMYMFQPTLFWSLLIFTAFTYLYLFGVGISGLYAKYKRALQIGISTWKIVLSWPFAYILTWTPGYLFADKKTKSSLTIKTNLYKKFNKMVLSNTTNLVFVFLTLLLLNTAIAGTSALILTILELGYFGLWVLKYKKDFIKNIDKTYALSAVFINVIMLLLLIISK
ncbi:MAG: hypothetical protein IKZ49_01560 [Alphaproteobacteria bacterium]|nr:hypothetical protein [Alphaproteobacteria bacterium]